MAALFSDHLHSSMISILLISSRAGVAVIFLVLLRYFTLRLLLVMLLLLARTGFLTICTAMRLAALLSRLSGLGLLKQQHRKLPPSLGKEQRTRIGNHHSLQLLKKLGTGTTVGSLMISQWWYHM
uniref:Uncharacterized protein n=1 Tax=Arundo donax TaxID=35708 RepID=A0A0A9DDK3_ARUDO